MSSKIAGRASSRVKLLTVVHYLRSLLPERLTQQRAIVELLGEPAPVWMSLLVLAGVVAVAVGLCLFLFQTRECQYKET